MNGGDTPAGARREVIVVAAGGTIASRSNAAGVAEAVESGAALVAALPAELRATLAIDDLIVSVHEVATADSSSLVLDQLDALAVAVAQALASDSVLGVVVTHGTDTMEETALLVDLSHHDPRPVVFTGAQHPADSPTPDGPVNLAQALAVAADPRMRGFGVLLSFAGEVRTAAGITKTSTVDPQPFRGGHAVASFGGVPPQRLTVPWAPIAATRVDIVMSYPGADGTLLDAAVAAGAAGIVLAGSGSANTTAALAAAAKRAMNRGVVVVAASRVATGEVSAAYGGGSGAADLVAAGAIVARQLRPGQARIALLALLAANASPRLIAAYLGQ